MSVLGALEKALKLGVCDHAALDRAINRLRAEQDMLGRKGDYDAMSPEGDADSLEKIRGVLQEFEQARLGRVRRIVSATKNFDILTTRSNTMNQSPGDTTQPTRPETPASNAIAAAQDAVETASRTADLAGRLYIRLLGQPPPTPCEPANPKDGVPPLLDGLRGLSNRAARCSTDACRLLENALNQLS